MLKIFKQTTYEGCLPVSLLILLDQEITREKEIEIILNAIPKYRDNHYALNILTSFIEIFNAKANLFVDNKFFSEYLSKQNKNNKINVTYHKLNTQFFLKLASPFAVYVDDFVLGEEAHSQHFIVIEKINNNSAIIIDPSTGKKSEIKIEILLNAIKSLKKTFFYCPLLITLNKYE